ncbi:MAG: hypothetical protein HYZ14_03045 [Bacteroidetes bacterium]|nr:hypothetical protein [Bacteroidota bacterium]
MFKPTIKQIKRVFAHKNFVLHEEKSYKLNVIGIRCGRTSDNSFHEMVVVVFQDDYDEQHIVYFPFTMQEALEYIKTELGLDACSFIDRKPHARDKILYDARISEDIANPCDAEEIIAQKYDLIYGLRAHQIELNHPSEKGVAVQAFGKFRKGSCGFETLLFLFTQAISHGNLCACTMLEEIDFKQENA